MTRLLERTYVWHSPHPGLMGALARIPGEARLAALEMADTATTGRAAVERIAAAVGRGYVVRLLATEPVCVLLSTDPNTYPVHCWRVIQGDPE